MQQDDTGLYGKYFVAETAGNSPRDFDLIERVNEKGRQVEIHRKLWRKSTPCFVLSPEKDDEYGEASRQALEAYAAAIEHKNSKLADDLREWLHSIENRHGHQVT